MNHPHHRQRIWLWVFALFICLMLVSALSAEPLGIRNNNPGNIRGRVSAWPGAIGVDKQGHLIFRRPIDGIRAIVINLRAYHRKHEIKTVNGIIYRWAEEHQEIYSDFVAESLGVRGTQHLNMWDTKTLRALTRAIIYFENGQDPYPARLYDRVFPTPAPVPTPLLETQNQ